VVSGFVISDGGYLDNPVVDSHDVGVFGELGCDFSCVVSLSLSCYHDDIHEALLGSSMHPVGDLIQSLIEVPDGESFPETSASIGSLSVAVTPSVLVVSSLVGWCIG
jgi:hypothetical protein